MPFISVTRYESVFDLSLISNNPGIIIFQVKGPNAYAKFIREAGGHRWQRVPPTEKRGRYQTSTITVAILESKQDSMVEIYPHEVRWEFCRGSGAGGQNRNKRDTAVRLTHIPTGIQIWCEEERSQHNNRKLAMERLKVKLTSSLVSRNHQGRSEIRQNQVGSGERGDKIRTIRVRDNQVKNHLNGKKTTYDRYLKGDFSQLLN